MGPPTCVRGSERKQGWMAVLETWVCGFGSLACLCYLITGRERSAGCLDPPTHPKQTAVSLLSTACGRLQLCVVHVGDRMWQSVQVTDTQHNYASLSAGRETDVSIWKPPRVMKESGTCLLSKIIRRGLVQIIFKSWFHIWKVLL